MIGALRDSVELQFRNGLQQATIRLDPAELGRVEIQVSHEAGRLHVQIQAGQGDVVRLLQQTSERLRQELAGQHFVEVSVQVGADSQQERRGRQAPSSWVSEPAVQVSQLVEDDSAAGDSRRSDVLITV
ncbi:flagellar hook-length control protein FliK [Pseudomonas seleniipraecipitans]|uniref:Flagellar hook-length control protein FliK n=2 Tax=Phytopseudomonas seleniipraecipitans TaxID=640205 RepID=A0ABY5JGV5_9GAMM|nr:flagellar hook-length control protein FliK [Pseudomonas seleniipraecipitans]